MTNSLVRVEIDAQTAERLGNLKVFGWHVFGSFPSTGQSWYFRRLFFTPSRLALPLWLSLGRGGLLLRDVRSFPCVQTGSLNFTGERVAHAVSVKSLLFGPL